MRRKCPYCKKLILIENRVFIIHLDPNCEGSEKMPKKKEFVYEQYNPDVEGYGSTDKWQKSFNFKIATNSLNGIDPWKVLGISNGSDTFQIKTAFRTKALLYHPDKNGGIDVQGRYQELLKAYTALR